MTQLTTQSRNWAMVAHLAAAGFEFFIPLFGFIGPAVVWMARRDDPDVVYHARQAVFFQLATSVTCWSLVAVTGAVSFLTCGTLGWIPALMAVPPAIAAVVVPLYGAMKVSNGQDWKYPITGPLVREDPPLLR